VSATTVALLTAANSSSFLLNNQQGNCNNLIKVAGRGWPDEGFLARLNYTRQRYSTLILRKRDASHAEWAKAVTKAGGKKLGESSWSQVFNGRQVVSVRTAIAIAAIGDVSLGWLLVGEGEAPEGYMEPFPQHPRPMRPDEAIVVPQPSKQKKKGA
jgi:hypothetical protein